METKISNEEETGNLQQGAVMRSFLIELAKKHNCDVNMLMVGMVFSDMHVWKYNEGAANVFQQLEIVSF